MIRDSPSSPFAFRLSPLLLGVVGVGLLLNASVLLIFESRIALASTYSEMDYIRRIGHQHAPPELRETRRWRMLR